MSYGRFDPNRNDLSPDGTGERSQRTIVDPTRAAGSGWPSSERRDPMGIRVQFWLGSADGIATHFLTGPLDRFETWAGQLAAEFPDEIGQEDLRVIGDIGS